MRSGQGRAAFLRRLRLPSKATPHALTPNRDSPTAAASPANIKRHLAPTDAALALLRPAREASPPTAPPLSIGGLRCRPPEVPRRQIGTAEFNHRWWRGAVGTARSAPRGGDKRVWGGGG